MKKLSLYYNRITIPLCCLLFVIESSAEQKNVEAPNPTGHSHQQHAGQASIRVLIVDGFNNHHWQQTTRLTKAILESSGLFTVHVSTAPSTTASSDWPSWQPAFTEYDVIIQSCNSYGNRPTWPPAIERKLESYVANGGGLYILHSGNNAFPEWPDYNLMIGLGWRDKSFGHAITVNEDGTVQRIPPGQGGHTGHGKRINALMTRVSDHPIHRGLPKQWLAADLEIYRYARGPAKNLTVLSYAQEPETGLNFPIEWTVNYGKGRVYNSTFGHVWKGDTNPPGMRCLAFQTLLIRSLQWLSGNEVSWPIPDKFPTKEAISLK